MNIIIIRHRYTKYGVDGILNINGHRICDTCEHPTNHIATGTYNVRLELNKSLKRKVPFLFQQSTGASKVKPLDSKYPFITIGNGTFKLTNGCIIIGERILSGVLIHSSRHFAKLIDRLEKTLIRGDTITIKVKDKK